MTKSLHLLSIKNGLFSQLISILFISFVPFIFTACSHQQEVSTVSIEQSHPTSNQALSVSKLNVPQWVNNPDFQGSIGVVGYARKQDTLANQKKVALIVAKARLSERLEIKINDTSLSLYSEKDNSQEFHTHSKQTSSNHINNVTVKEEYLDKDGTLYLWIVTQSKGIK